LEEPKSAATCGGRTEFRWENVIKKDVEQLGSDSNWQNLSLDKEEWEIVFETGWSKSLINPKRSRRRNYF